MHFKGTARQTPRLTILNLLGKTKVDQLQVALGVYQNVFWLEVPISNTFPFVQIFKD